MFNKLLLLKTTCNVLITSFKGPVLRIIDLYISSYRNRKGNTANWWRENYSLIAMWSNSVLLKLFDHDQEYEIHYTATLYTHTNL